MLLEDALEDPHPPAEFRQLVPQESMEFWNTECWYDWIVNSFRTFSLAEGEVERIRSFWPLNIDKDLFVPNSIPAIIRKVLSAKSYERFSDALARRTKELSESASAEEIITTIKAASSIDFWISPVTFNRLCIAIVDNVHPKKFPDIANAFSALVHKRSDPRLAYELISVAPEIFASSNAAAPIFAAVIAKFEENDFLETLSEIYPEIFDLSPQSESWAYVVDKLLEICGPHVALKAAYSSTNKESWIFRIALHIHRISITPQIRWTDVSSRRGLDRLRQTEFLVRADFVEMMAEYSGPLDTALTIDRLLTSEDHVSLSYSDFSTHNDLRVWETGCEETIH